MDKDLFEKIVTAAASYSHLRLELHRRLRDLAEWANELRVVKHDQPKARASYMEGHKNSEISVALGKKRLDEAEAELRSLIARAK
jgi:hypothetical protein